MCFSKMSVKTQEEGVVGSGNRAANTGSSEGDLCLQSEERPRFTDSFPPSHAGHGAENKTDEGPASGSSHFCKGS